MAIGDDWICVQDKAPDKPGKYLITFVFLDNLEEVRRGELEFVIYEDGSYEWMNMPQAIDHNGFQVLAWKE